MLSTSGRTATADTSCQAGSTPVAKCRTECPRFAPRSWELYYLVHLDWIGWGGCPRDGAITRLTIADCTNAHQERPTQHASETPRRPDRDEPTTREENQHYAMKPVKETSGKMMRPLIGNWIFWQDPLSSLVEGFRRDLISLFSGPEVNEIIRFRGTWKMNATSDERELRQSLLYAVGSICDNFSTPWHCHCRDPCCIA
jgi:hypothetical protein